MSNRSSSSSTLRHSMKSPRTRGGLNKMPFRVDYAGDVIDLSKRSSKLDDLDDFVLEQAAASSTESETEIPLNDDDLEAVARSPKLRHHSSNDYTSRTDRTEVSSMGSSVSSHSPEDVLEAIKSIPPTAATVGAAATKPAASTTASSSQEIPPTPRNSRVSFSQIQIREYPIIVGDNPAVLTGTPVTIDWEFVQEMQFQLDDYEDHRVQTPRTMVELRMPASHRDRILKTQGFSLAERNQGKKVANVTKNRRKRTSETMKLSKAAEHVELWTRATKNATWGRKRKQEERNYLLPFREH